MENTIKLKAQIDESDDGIRFRWVTEDNKVVKFSNEPTSSNQYQNNEKEMDPEVRKHLNKTIFWAILSKDDAEKNKILMEAREYIIERLSKS